MEPVVKIKDANVFLDRELILSNINWEVNKGDHWFILGANGAGKTTLVRMLMGLVWPKFGAEVSVLGGIYGKCNLFETRKKISWVSPFLQKWTAAKWSVLEVALSGLDGTIGLYKKHSESDKKKALSIMEKLDCAGIAGHSYDKISSGEQIKALIARALISNPELIILDEPFVHLDMKSREFLMNSVNNLAKSPAAPTILFITQRIEDISPVFEKGMILKNGAIVERGDRDDILTEDNLFKAFDMRVKLHKSKKGRYWPELDDA